MGKKLIAVLMLAAMMSFGLSGAGIALADTGSAGEGASVPSLELSTASTSGEKPAKPASAQLKQFKKASADFSLELFGRCVAAKGKNANVTIAPMSVMTAMAISANGAKGKTLNQMRNVLGDGATMTQINENLAWYNSRLVNVKKARISSANAIWYHNGNQLTVKKAFLSKAKKYYGATVKASDFSDPATVDDINGWVAEKTNNMIKKIISKLEPDDRIAIVNALYFDAEWAVPYEKASVQTKTFTAANGTKRKVKMMYGTEHKYIEGKNVTGFIKPYAKGYSYVALLPKKGLSLKKFVKTLDGDTFRSLIANAEQATVRTALPKYTLSYSNDEMEKQLAAMGMPLAFAENADFTRMGKGENNLYLSTVAHKTKIIVDERGTKAAAATAVIVADATAFITDEKVVTLDRPFVYAIIDNTTNLPVFIGTVNDIK